MAASHGFEPRLTESESAVLPLDDEAICLQKKYIYQSNLKCKQNFHKNTNFL